MAANWECEDCGEIVFASGEPGPCMSCGAGSWAIHKEPEPDPEEAEAD